MKIYQLLVTLQRGDAIGNYALLLAEFLKKQGFEISTFAYFLGSGLHFGYNDIYPIQNMPTPDKGDLVLYHLCEGTPINELLQGWHCKKIAFYHNVTPPHFFAWLDTDVAARQRQSLYEVAILRDAFDRIIADSPYNRDELVRMGYSAEEIDVIPILMDFPDYQQEPDGATIRRWKDGRTNVLFVGRIAPNKKHEDVIRAFAWYKKHVDITARLILIGSTFSEAYQKYLDQYIKNIGVQDVVFPGHISFRELLGFYSAADLFLCMSEHEGFCVPLVEAMLFRIPIVAYANTAIPSTLDEGGILLPRKDPVLAGTAMKKLMQDPEFRMAVLERQEQRLKDFDPELIGQRILKIVEKVAEAT